MKRFSLSAAIQICVAFGLVSAIPFVGRAVGDALLAIASAPLF